MSRRMWKAVETEAREVRVAKSKIRKKIRRKRIEKEKEKI